MIIFITAVNFVLLVLTIILVRELRFFHSDLKAYKKELDAFHQEVEERELRVGLIDRKD